MRPPSDDARTLFTGDEFTISAPAAPGVYAYHCIFHSYIRGTLTVSLVALTAPEPVTNREFANTLARVLRRPALLPVPNAVVAAIFGEMADETLLADLAVVPRRLFSLGYCFRYPDLEAALRHVLGRPLP